MKKLRYVIICAVLLADYLVKLLVRSTMYCGQTIPVIQGFFSITYVQNRGAAFSLFTGRGAMIMIITFLALCFAVWYMERHKDGHWTLLLALELIISGGAGNLIDRAFLGFVTDMFDMHFWWFIFSPLTNLKKNQGMYDKQEKLWDSRESIHF